MIASALILQRSQLAAWREDFPKEKSPLVLTNGCFDLLHPGHVTYLTQARNLGGFLVVAVNSDDSVRALKGPSRPINSAADRCAVLAGLRCVDAVVVFTEPRVTGVINDLRPHIYAKGGDYTLETLDAGEAAALRACGARIELLGLVPGKSTTDTLARLQRA